MARSKIGYHVAANCGGCGGIEAYWAALNAAGIPFVAYSANDAGLITAAAKYEHATLIYRDVAASTVDPADYDWDPSQAADAYWNVTKLKLPISIRESRARCWIELLNEPGKEGGQADWVGWLMFHMAALARADGYRVMGPGWSPGTPEPEHWYLPGWKAYLQLCAAYPGQAAVSLHEYSLENDIHHLEPWLVGRFQFLMKACGDMGIAPPAVYITECGWTLNSMPPDAQAKADIDYLAQLYADWPEIKGANLWTLQSGEGNGDLPARLNGLMPWLTTYTLSTEFDDPPPVEPPPTEPPDMSNQLFNPSFELDWTDATDFPGHIPEGWTVKYNYGDDYPNPYGQPYKNGEAVKKHKGMLPAAEQDEFVWDGEWTYKIFGGGTKSFWFQMSQTVNLTAGQYEIVTPVWVDHYHSIPGGGKNYMVDPRQAEISIVVNGNGAGDWTSLKSGMRWDIETEFGHTGGLAQIDIHLRANWDINGNFWLDGLSLTAVGVEPPPPPSTEKHKAIVVLLPQDVTADEMASCAKEAHKNLHTMTPSHDDCLTMLNGGNAESYAKIYRPERQPDRVAAIEAAGYAWVEFLPAAVMPPFRSIRTRWKGSGS